jgi:hypothetical protein
VYLLAMNDIPFLCAGCQSDRRDCGAQEHGVCVCIQAKKLGLFVCTLALRSLSSHRCFATACGVGARFQNEASLRSTCCKRAVSVSQWPLAGLTTMKGTCAKRLAA